MFIKTASWGWEAEKVFRWRCSRRLKDKKKGERAGVLKGDPSPRGVTFLETLTQLPSILLQQLYKLQAVRKNNFTKRGIQQIGLVSHSRWKNLSKQV